MRLAQQAFGTLQRHYRPVQNAHVSASRHRALLRSSRPSSSSSGAPPSSSSATNERGGGLFWVGAFSALLAGANFFTIWQETDAHDLAERRKAEYEANKKAWEERERRETKILELKQRATQGSSSSVS